MMERQRVLADFGALALRSDDLDAVLTEACSLVARALGCELAKILEVEDDGATLFVRAGVGWQPGVVGVVHLPMCERSSETYSIEAGVPVFTPNISKEDRFEFPRFLLDAGVVGIVNVPIFLPGGKAFGLLQVDSREAWSPGDDEIQFLRTYAAILGPVIDRLHKVHALKEATDRNRILLLELQHRIKNNIAAISSLVRKQIKTAKSADARAELAVVGERVEALSLVHEHVYASNRGDRLSLRTYATELLRRLLALHCQAGVRLEASIEEVDIASDTAIPLGLILNEFATNSLKHAFSADHTTGHPVIRIEAGLRDDRIWVHICDNGSGRTLQPPPKRGSGTGLALIAGLSQQIGARPNWCFENGTSLHLEFKRR